MHAESLPTEIWLEIFSYLHPRYNIEAFLNLNRFFNRFASTKYFGVHHCLRPEEYTPNTSKSFAESLRLETIRSISDGGQGPQCLIQFLRSNTDKLVHLRKISICLRFGTIITASVDFIDTLERLPSLRSIVIESNMFRRDSEQMKVFLSDLFSERLPLTHCQLLFSFEYFDSHAVQWSGSSSIRYLTLHEISWSNLLSILSQTRDLVYLNVSITPAQFEPSKLIFPLLRRMVLNIRETPFAVLAEIRQSAPGLTSLSIRGSFSTDDENYFQENLWKKLLDQICSYDIHLKKLICNRNETEQIKRIHASLGQRQWFKFLIGTFVTNVEISFQS